MEKAHPCLSATREFLRPIPVWIHFHNSSILSLNTRLNPARCLQVSRQSAEEARSRYESLSDREYQVMCLIAIGKTVSDIADEMSLSVKTISTYRSRILEKLNLKNNAEITRYYMRFCTETVQCQNCQKGNPPEARFCAYCGADLAVTDELPSSALGPPPELSLAGIERAGFW